MTGLPPRKYWYSQVIVWVSLVAMVIGGVIYTNKVAAAEGRKFCGVFAPLDAAYRKTPPASPAGRQFAAAVHKVVTDLGCDEPAPAAPLGPTGEKPR